MNKCVYCNSWKEFDGRCPVCYQRRCVICKNVIYRDESMRTTSGGKWVHSRCATANKPVGRPFSMSVKVNGDEE